MSVTGHDLADSRFGTHCHALGVGGTDGNRSQLATSRCPVDIFDRGAMLRVEEAWGTAHGQRLSVNAGTHAFGGVATVFEGLGDTADVGGLVDVVERLLGNVIGVQGLLVVLRAAGVEFDSGGEDIEFGDFLTEGRDILFSGLCHLLELGGGELLLTVLLLAVANEENGAEHHEYYQEYCSHDLCLPSKTSHQSVCRTSLTSD